MATTITSYSDIGQRTSQWAAVEMLAYAEPVLVLSKFGLTKPVPKNKAQTIAFRRPDVFSAATTALQEGVTPTAQKMSYTDVTATLRQYGKPIIITDFVNDVCEDPVMRDAARQAGHQAALTAEMLTWNVIKAGTNVIYANGAARTSVNTPISLNRVRGAVRSLMAQKAMKHRSMLAPSTDYGTKGIEACFIAVAHTDCAADIRDLPGFVPTVDYGSRQLLCPEEIGAVEDVRFVLSPELTAFTDAGGAKAGSGTTMVSTTGTSADVYPVLVFGAEAYGIVPLKGAGSITPMVVNPKPSAADPLAQRGFVSWKIYHAAVILNQNWIQRLEVAVTDIDG